ncbi:hydrogen peroxide-inducible genes activator [Sulfuriferula thiophila]|uniref:hydrogen peroxide-inducible genes activator n=1 Tax=Sulfuriferula thiophila TaxID=1781211 RepID=UPI000F611620|nr:hydrogen peroxide-inducible genes activator [Sulfuriferula thiophila]
MTLTELRYIVAVAREHHFGRAAEACFVSQPTLSVAIKKLEEELGIAIFERANNEVSVTPIGARIVEQAAHILEQTGTLKQIAQQGKNPLIGSLRLGAIFTIAPYVLPHLIPALHKLAPQMPLLLEENFTRKLTEKLRQGELDVIIISLPFDEPGMETLTLYHEPFQVALPSEHPWRDKASVDVNELTSENMLLLGSGHCFRDQVLQACPALNRSSAPSGSIQKTLESSSLETIRYMVASGVGITVMPCTAITQTPIEQGLLSFRPFTAPVPDRAVALAWRKSYPRMEAIEALRQAMLQCKLPCVSWVPSLSLI